MEHLEQIVKALSVVLVTLGPFLKSFFGHADRGRHLDERYKRLKGFFDDGATARHPMLVEASFASAVGHAKLSSQEIELLLRQLRPTQFMDQYLRSRDHIGPNADGDQFELRGFAKNARARKTLVILGGLFYTLMVGPAFWALLFILLPKALNQSWSIVLGDFALFALMMFVGFVALIVASKLSLAATLVRQQVGPNAEAAPEAAPMPVLEPLPMEETPAPALPQLESTVAAAAERSEQSLVTS